jgi:3-dehydroquinate synthase
VGDDLIERLGQLTASVAAAHSFAIVTDSNVGPLYGERVLSSFADRRVRLFTIPAGEANKSVATWTELTDSILAAGFGRDSVIVALGGGIVGDVAGFAAATFMRGIPYVQVPTTLMAMVDSSIGGKTGVNAPAGKNLIGAFHQPAAVFTDPRFLGTLPDRELRAGLAEVIKHGAIADAGYFSAVRNNLPELIASRGAAPMMREVIARSIEIKANVVARDERETGLRKILNFGHTIGHAIEALVNYELLHGEAISIGMCAEARIAERAGIAAPGTADAVRDALTLAGLPTELPRFSGPDILNAAASQKKSWVG